MNWNKLSASSLIEKIIVKCSKSVSRWTETFPSTMLIIYFLFRRGLRKKAKYWLCFQFFKLWICSFSLFSIILIEYFGLLVGQNQQCEDVALGFWKIVTGICYYFSIILYYSTCKQTHSITGKLQKIEQKCVSLWLHVSVLNAETRTWNWFTASQFNKKANVDPNPSCLGEPETASYCPAVIQMERSDGGKTDLHLGRTYSLYALHAWRMRSTFQRCFWEVGCLDDDQTEKESQRLAWLQEPQDTIQHTPWCLTGCRFNPITLIIIPPQRQFISVVLLASSYLTTFTQRKVDIWTLWSWESSRLEVLAAAL